MVSVARPLPSVALPSVTDPSRNVTVPVGVPVAEPDADTLAVNVTACPYTADAAEEATTVTEPAGAALCCNS